MAWHSYTKGLAQHTVVGELLINNAVYSPHLDNTRHLLVWLPPSYRSTEQHYPVLYMHDGDSLFDAKMGELSNEISEWQVDESMMALAQDGIEAIIVGIPNMREARFSEYSPYDHVVESTQAHIRGHGDDYLRFIVDTIKPLIDADFRTKPSAGHTGIAGSSMGGLISLYGFLKHPDIFSMCAAFSPVFWFNNHALLQMIESHVAGDGRIYLDIGTVEGAVIQHLGPQGLSDAEADAYYVDGVRQLHQTLLGHGYDSTNTYYIEDPGARHDHDAWAKRFPIAIQFLFDQ